MARLDRVINTPRQKEDQPACQWGNFQYHLSVDLDPLDARYSVAITPSPLH